MNQADNCATSLEDLEKGTHISNDDRDLSIRQDIPLGHKFALEEIKKGAHVIKYGQVIGQATKKIEKGDWIHTHNITSAYLEGNSTVITEGKTVPDIAEQLWAKLIATCSGERTQAEVLGFNEIAIWRDMTLSPFSAKFR